MSVETVTPSMFSSIAALRAAHRELQRKQREDGDSPALQDRIDSFLRRAQATGAILDSEEDQISVQGIMDLWVTTLYRVGRHTGDLTLAEFDPSLAPALDNSIVPYVGLASFDEKERDKFFGRQKMSERLLKRLKTENLIVVIGPSGSGKSSLVLAGLLPSIRKGDLPGSQDWAILHRVVPGSDPLANLARCVRPANAEAGWSQRQAAAMRSNPNHLRKLADEYAQGQTCVFVIDQFEELSTLCDDEEAHAAVEHNLVNLLSSNNPRHILVATMRSDFIGAVVRQPQMQALLEKALEPVTPLSAPELREAIEKPAERVGLKFEQGVVESLVHDILGEPAALPLLQFTLLKLWETRERNRVTLAAYRKLGGGRLALTRSADKFYESLIPEDKTMVDRILLRVVRPGQGQDVVSSRIRKSSLLSIGIPEQVDRVTAKLIDERLLRLTEGETPDDAEVEVAHEALVRNWNHLVQLLDTERERMTRGRRLEAKAADWVRLGRGKAGLLFGSALVEAEQWISSEDARVIGATLELSALIEASRRAERASARRQFRVKMLLALLAAIALFFAIVARIQRNQAVAKTKDAEFNWNKAILSNEELQQQQDKLRRKDEETVRLNEELRKRTKQLNEKAHLYDSDHLADAAARSLSSDPEVSALRALESSIVMSQVHKPNSNETEDALHQAVLANRAKLSIPAPKGYRLLDAALSPDGRHIIVAGDRHTMQSWNSLSGEAETVPEARNSANVAFSFNGDRATDSAVGIRILFADGRVSGTFKTDGSLPTRLALSANGQKLAAVAGTQAYLWDVKTAHRIGVASDSAAKLNSVALSLDGALLATASDDGLTTIYETASGHVLRELKGPPSPVTDVAFSPSSEWIATASADRYVRIWYWLDVSRPDLLRPDYSAPRQLQGHLEAVSSVAFSLDGSKLATGSQDGTTKVWSARTWTEQFTLPNSNVPVKRVQFNMDGSRLMTAGDDGSVRLWNTGPAEELQATSLATLSSVKLSAMPSAPTILVAATNSDRVATGSSDGTFRVWAATERGLSLERMIHRTSRGSAVAINETVDLAAAATLKQIEIYDLKSGDLKKTIEIPAVINAMALSRDGKRILSSNSNKQLQLWDVESGKILASQQMESAVTAVTLSSSGKRAAAASNDGQVVVYNGSLSKQLASFHKHAGPLNTIAFSPDERHLVSGGFDKTAKVWNVDQPLAAPINLLGHTRPIMNAAFSADGQKVVTSSSDGTTKVWPLNASADPFTLGDSSAATPVCCAGFSRNGQRLFSASNDGTLRVYPLTTAEVLALALSKLSRMFVPQDCDGQEEPKLCQTLLPQINRIAEGNRQARAGRIDLARHDYSQALGQHLALKPEDLLREIAQERQEDMRHLEVDGKTALALGMAAARLVSLSGATLEQAIQARAVEGYPADFKPETIEKNLYHDLYKELATMVVRTRNEDVLAAGYFQEYLSLSPTLERDIQHRVNQLMLANLQYVARNEINLRRLNALTGPQGIFARARKFSDDSSKLPETDPTWLNQVCWFGSLRGLHADADIRESCEQAVKLSDARDTRFLDSRALNRALNGDYQGAIDDFERFANDPLWVQYREERLKWIVSLKAGEMPFDAALKKQMDSQDASTVPISPPFY